VSETEYPKLKINLTEEDSLINSLAHHEFAVMCLLLEKRFSCFPILKQCLGFPRRSDLCNSLAVMPWDTGMGWTMGAPARARWASDI